MGQIVSEVHIIRDHTITFHNTLLLSQLYSNDYPDFIPKVFVFQQNCFYFHIEGYFLELRKNL